MSEYGEERSYSLLPANSSALEQALDLGFARFLDRVAPPFPDLMNPATTPVDFLSYLAAERGVAEWDTDAPEAEKRSMVAMSWPTKRLAGTTAAIKSALKGLQLTADISPWHKQVPKGEPYTFKIVVWVNSNRGKGQTILSESLYPQLHTAIGAAKSERSSYALQIGVLFTGGWRLANTSQAYLVHRRTVEAPPVPIDPSAQALQFANTAQAQALHRHTMETPAVPIPPSAQALYVASVTQARAVARDYAETLPVPIHSEATLLTANAMQARIVVRGTMEAVL